ncbi:MAG TPA: hypothetical protein VMO26_20410 [Vicinamibacterales bacterium]|nr:hypothetical protein [Vicinamibacterales bacterium]
MTAPLTDADLVEQFERATLAAGQFHHAQHVRVAWLYVRRYGLPGALEAFPAALGRFALAQGAPHLYHVTITWAYLLLIHARQQACHAAGWEDFATANTDLLAWKPSILDDYYTPETLWSEFARQTFVMPDRGLLTR